MSGAERKRRVVITGLGVVAPNGTEVPDFWRSVCRGESAAARLSRFDPEPFPSRTAAEIKDFDATRYLDRKLARRVGRSTQYGLVAVKQAIRDSGLDLHGFDPDRIGIIEGSTLGGLEGTLNVQRALDERGYRGISPFALVNSYFGGGSSEIAVQLGFHGHAVTYSTGSASGNDGIGYAARMIEGDEVDVMVAGGNEAPLVPAFWGGFCHARVMTVRNKDPQGAMRPFDRQRDGFLLGEGAGYVVLEELAHALGRGAPIYAEVGGHGRSCEGYQSVGQHPDGLGVTRAIEKALWQARAHPEEVDYINAHGTATESNDPVETRGIKAFFNEKAYDLLVSATKPVTGHLLGASGGVETVICALTLKERVVPPTINLTDPEPACDLNYVTGQARHYPVRVALNLNSGFGGKNSCLVLKAFHHEDGHQ